MRMRSRPLTSPSLLTNRKRRAIGKPVRVDCRAAAITMKVCSGGARAAVLISVALLYLAASSLSPVRDVDAKATRLADGGNIVPDVSAPETCKEGSKELRLSGAQTSITFKCPGASKQILAPVELVAAQEPAGPGAKQPKLDQAYVVTAATGEGKTKTCDTKQVQTLEELAPGSELAVAADKKAALKGLSQDESDAKNATVFTLQLGDRQDVDKHFCYTCNEAVLQSRSEPPCTIFVTVPKKENPGTTDPPSDSGSLSSSVVGWSTLAVAGCMVGSILRC